MPLSSFHYPFRKYQRMILSRLEADSSDRKLHIVAPPGSGKTIVGLEMVRRFGHPAVIFAPTTTIQAQWREKTAMFLNDPSTLDEVVSMDPCRLAEINIFTYQLISTPGEALEWVQSLAMQRWQDDLLSDGQVKDAAAAQARLETLKRNNPGAHRDELARRYQKVKSALLHGPGFNPETFLHPNACKLIRSLVTHGVRTVVLDECHHLLDYWAIVLESLVAQIDDPYVIGLTATLPSLEDEEEYENYTSLLGDVDFEVPTPAVVKEGDLAPYRDLVYFVEPSNREMSYLKNNQQAFEEAVTLVTRSPGFRNWLRRVVWERPDQDGKTMAWDVFLNEYPLLSLAALRCLRRFELTLPMDLPLPRESEVEPLLDDWALLLERYGLDVLKLSSDPEDQRTLMKLKKALLPFGFTLTERGLRQNRSPGDLVLAYSESKDMAVVEILRAEHQSLGKTLRAVVVTDFERLSNGVGRLEGVLDSDAGSALRLFYRLASHPSIQPLHPVLITGKLLMVEASQSEELLNTFNEYLKARNLRAVCRAQPGAAPAVVEVNGEGSDWSPRTYVSMVTAAFEQGKVQALVATRGLLGEGWDSLSLNTLIDLTSVTTSASVQQLRGRSIRLDPLQPRKVAHNWDVICVASQFQKGDYDLKRFVQRHERYWGVTPPGQLEQLKNDVLKAAAPPRQEESSLPETTLWNSRGLVVKGLAHVCPQLAYELSVAGFRLVNYEHHTRNMLYQVKRRDEDYEIWGVGDPYSNFSYSATRLDTSDLKIRTVYHVQETLKAMLRSFTATLLAGASLGLWAGLNPALENAGEDLGTLLVLVPALLATGFVAAFLLNLKRAWKLARAMLVEQPADAILLDIGRALLEALKETGLVSRSLQSDYVRAIEQADGSVVVLLDYASPEDAAIFIKAYRQIFAPLRDQRYLIERSDRRLPALLLRPLWIVLRSLFARNKHYDEGYRPVPDVLAVRKERAEAFANALAGLCRRWETGVYAQRGRAAHPGAGARQTADGCQRPGFRNLALS